jgi:hypothetical protein
MKRLARELRLQRNIPHPVAIQKVPSIERPSGGKVSREPGINQQANLIPASQNAPKTALFTVALGASAGA